MLPQASHAALSQDARGELINGEAGVIMQWVNAGIILINLHVKPLVVLNARGEILHLEAANASPLVLTQLFRLILLHVVQLLDVRGKPIMDGVRRNKMLSAGIQRLVVMKQLVEQLRDADGKILAGAVLKMDLMLEELQVEAEAAEQWALNVTNMTEIKQLALIVRLLE